MKNREVMEGLRKLHVNCGHASKGDMLRMLKCGKARARALALCREFKCRQCDEHAAPKISRSVKPRNTTHFGERVGFDLVDLELCDGTKITGLNMVDTHTTLQIM